MFAPVAIAAAAVRHSQSQLRRSLPRAVAVVSSVHHLSSSSSSSRSNSSSFSSSSAAQQRDALRAWTWGAGSSGIMGRGSKIETESLSPVPFLVGNGSEHEAPNNLGHPSYGQLAHIDFGPSHVMYCTDKGHLFSYGEGKFGQLGHGEKVDSPRTEHTLLPDLPNPAVEVAVGKYHSVVRDSLGKLYSCGYAGSWLSSTALGYKSSDGDVLALRPFPDDSPIAERDIVQLASGSEHMVALDDSGAIWVWGNGEYGRLGTSGSGSETEPVELTFFSEMGMKATQIASGGSFSAALFDSGELWMWGRNDKNQLTQPDHSFQMDVNAFSTQPERIMALNDADDSVIHVALGHKHTVCVSSANQAYMWGASRWAQPQLMSGDDDVMIGIQIERVAAGHEFSFALDNNGGIFSWGKGSSRCLGHGDKSNVRHPESIAGFGAARVEGSEYFGHIVDVFANQKRVVVLTRDE